MSNSPNLTWYICQDRNGEVAAFSSVRKSGKRITYVTDFFVDDVNALKKIMEMKKSIYNNSDLSIFTVHNNSVICNLFKEYGFVQYKSTTNYLYFVLEMTKKGGKE